ncbi:hypothetical protein MMC28_001439 [Mycoblastus sanguinarius]|nr:hypothetical protein [Mycoblastus sanguinarius]
MPGQAEAQAQSSSEAYDPHADQMVYGTSSLYEPRATYEATQSNFNDFSLRKAPEVSSYNPQRGSGGSQVCVYFDSSSDLLAPSPLIASLMFATRRIPAALNRLETRERDVCYKYVVTADAPSFSTTGSTNARVPLRVQFQEQSGQDAGLVDVGPFLYTDDQQAEPRYSSHEASRKRKQPVESSVSSRLAEPAQIQQQMNVNSQDYSSYSYTTGGNLAYPQSLHSIDLTSMQRRLTPYGRSQSQSSYHNASSTTGGQDFPGVAAVSQSFMRPPMPQTSAWSPSYTGSYQPSTPQSFPLVSSPSPDLANPQLVRTTKLQQSQSPGSTTAGSSSGEPYNPWAIYPNKADLKIQGSLNSMQEKWTPEEIAAKRRLIRFRREQSGTIINAYFRPCKADERLSPHETGEPRISCIYWEERQEYFVTSVDTISLLEYLVRTRFGVEEKNRIRRNLEGFHPLTVSKAKQDSEEFFKVVMGFPNPKPRNIEKDVKVFLWKDLNMALKKIISKYVS